MKFVYIISFLIILADAAALAASPSTNRYKKLRGSFSSSAEPNNDPGERRKRKRLTDISGTVVPIKAGLEATPSVGLGDLYKGIKNNIQTDESAITTKLFEYDPQNITYEPCQGTYYYNQIIQKESDISDAFGIDGSLSVTVGPYGGGGGFGFARQTASSKNSITVVWTIRHQLYSARPNDSYTPIPEIDELLRGQSSDENDDDIQHTIADRYGTRIIDEIIYGAQLDLTFKLTSDSELNVNDVKVNLQGQIGEGPLIGDLALHVDTEHHSNVTTYNLEIESSVMGLDLAIPSSPSFNETLYVIGNFTEKYLEVLNYINEHGVDPENDIIHEMSPVAYHLVETSQHIEKISPNTHAILEERLSENARTLRSVILHIGKLDQQKQTLSERFSKGRERFRYYHPWYRKYLDFKAEVLMPKYQECRNFQMQSTKDIVNTRAGDTPKDLPESKLKELDGLLGFGYVAAPITLEGKTYNDIYWSNGYVLDGKPAILGSLGCVATRLDVATANTTAVLARTIPTDACIKPCPHFQNVCESSQCVAFSDKHQFDIETDENGCCSDVTADGGVFQSTCVVPTVSPTTSPPSSASPTNAASQTTTTAAPTTGNPS